MESYKVKLRKVNTFIFDVDGVLTNGQVFLLENEVVRQMNSRDSYAIQYARKMGYKIYVITGGHSEAMKKRLLGLGVHEVFLSSSNKLAIFNQLKEATGIRDEEVLYVGDDIPDYQVMRTVGIAACPQDAAPEIKAISDYQSPYDGGKHCVRDVIEQTLKVQGKWFQEEAFDW